MEATSHSKLDTEAAIGDFHGSLPQGETEGTGKQKQKEPPGQRKGGGEGARERKEEEEEEEGLGRPWGTLGTLGTSKQLARRLVWKRQTTVYIVRKSSCTADVATAGNRIVKKRTTRPRKPNRTGTAAGKVGK